MRILPITLLVLGVVYQLNQTNSMSIANSLATVSDETDDQYEAISNENDDLQDLNENDGKLGIRNWIFVSSKIDFKFFHLCTYINKKKKRGLMTT